MPESREKVLTGKTPGIPGQGIPSNPRENGAIWHALPVDQVMRLLGTRDDGLPKEAAAAARERYGRNALSVKRPPGPIYILLRQFAAPLVLVLIGAAGLSAFLGEMGETIIIMATVAATVLFGFFQETKAERALQRLKESVRPAARVVRGGKESIVDASSLVPGDIIIVEAGDMIPADARIVLSHDAGTDESSLTGEAMTVSKSAEPASEAAALSERSSMLWQGTLMARGSARAVIVATGAATEWSKVVRSLAEVREGRTPLQDDLLRLTGWAMRAVAAAIAVFALVSVYRGFALEEIVLLALALAVAAIPEGITVTITAVLALGMVRMLEAKALVRRLVSAETLGSVSVLCLDKTGTLTEGRMRVVEASGDRRRALALAVSGVGARIADTSLPEKRWKALGDPTEVALLEAAIAEGSAKAYLSRNIIDDLPFSSDRRFRATVAEVGGKVLLVVVGAPETVQKRCIAMESGGAKIRLGDKETEGVTRLLGGYHERAIRTVALAYSELESPMKVKDALRADHRLTLVSMIGLSDPVRSDAAETIAHLRKAGVRIVMVTGDNPATATAVASQVGIGTGRVVSWETVAPGEEPEGLYADTDIFARVPPADKLRIVRGFQRLGHAVAMTGDGVNDAPALKQADIGVVMGSGQDVAKGIADLVLMDDRLERIYRAVLEGRRIYENIRKIAIFLVYNSFVETVVVTAAVVVGSPLPLLPAQILWVNVVADTLPSMGYAWEHGDHENRTSPPRERGERLLTASHKAFMVALGASAAMLLLALYMFALRSGGDIDYVRTMVFVGLGLGSLFVAYSLRSMRKSVFHIRPFGNPFMIAALVSGAVLYLVAIYVPAISRLLHTTALSVGDWAILVVFSALHLVLSELYKAIFLWPAYGRQAVVKPAA